MQIPYCYLIILTAVLKHMFLKAHKRVLIKTELQKIMRLDWALKAISRRISCL
jgi:hypothetical protein